MGWQIIAVGDDHIVRARRSSPSMIGGICNSYHFIQNADRMHGPKEAGVDNNDRASLVRVFGSCRQFIGNELLSLNGS
jgi:hypothetical protein